MNFISTWKNLLKHCIFANLLTYCNTDNNFVLILHIFVSYFGKVLQIPFASIWNSLLKHCISAECLLIEGIEG